MGVTPASRETGASHDSAPVTFPYVLRWDRYGRKGQVCRIVSHRSVSAGMGCAIQFADGVVRQIPRAAIVRRAAGPLAAESKKVAENRQSKIRKGAAGAHPTPPLMPAGRSAGCPAPKPQFHQSLEQAAMLPKG